VRLFRTEIGFQQVGDTAVMTAMHAWKPSAAIEVGLKRVVWLAVFAVVLTSPAQAQWKVHWHGPSDPRSGWWRQLKDAQQAFDKLRGQITSLSAQIASVTNRINALNSNINSLQSKLPEAKTALAAANTSKTQAETVLAGAQAELQRLTALRDQAETAWNQAKVDAANAVAALKASQLIAFDVTTSGTLTYNLVNGAFYGRFTLPDGVSYDSEAIKRLIATGQPSLPQYNPVQLVMGAFGVELDQTSHYEDRRQAVTAANPGSSVYFASQRFVDWLSPETAVSYAANIVATGEAGVESAIDQTREMLLLEFQEIMAWAYLRGEQNLESTAASALSSLATQQGFHVDEVKLNLDWETVDYDYHPRLSGLTEFPIRLIPGAAAKLNDATAKIQAERVLPSSPHGAFAAVWSSPTRKIDDVAKALLAAKSAQLSAKFDSLLVGALDKVTQVNLPKAVLKQLDGLVVQSVADPGLPSNVVQKLQDTFKIDPDWLNQAIALGQFIVDLHDKPIGNTLSGLLKNFAVGNEGSATLLDLELDLGTGRISCDFNLRHRHSWGSLDQALADFNKFATQTSGVAQLDFDAFTNSLDAEAVRPLVQSVKSTESAVASKLSQLNILKAQVADESNRIPGFSQQLALARSALLGAEARLGQLSGAISRETKTANDLKTELNKLNSQESGLNTQVRHLDNVIKDLKHKLRLP
jgi:predicted  nucleic acid-binding Zn-ribbon protein